MIRSGFILSVCLVVSASVCFSQTTRLARTQWPQAVAFISKDCSLKSNALSVFRIKKTRAYFEFDLPMPSKIGRQLHIIRPALPGVKPKLLLDMGKGTIGSPSGSLDGKFIYASVAPEGEFFYHIHKIPTDGSKPTRITKGPFHDLDPAELPDGRIVFSSTRIGTFEEYHSSPSRGLFVMNGDGSDITPITFTSIFDNEPKVMADGSIVFIRSDNFLERAKVETRLHAIRPDGTGGRSIAAADRGATYGARLRKFGFGSPAPLPDGRLAFISAQGNLLINPGAPRAKAHRLPGNLQDLAPLPNSRLLCTTNSKKNNTIAIINPDKANQLTTLFQSKDGNIHSAVYAGPWPKPKTATVNALRIKNATTGTATGYFLCQNARITRKTAADWPLIRSVRAIGGKVSTLRSSNFQAVHAGLEAIELGTAALAPDGSFFVEVPADTPIAFQMLDAEGRPQLNEMSWIFVRPGETKSCIGCHESRGVAPRPADKRIEATKARPVKLLGQGKPIRFRGQNPWVNGLMDMQFERIREIASIGQRGFGKNPNATGAAEWKTVESWLASKDVGLRISACQRLGGTHGRRYSGSLADLLKDPDREVRAAAGLALSACGNRTSLPHLLAALDDSDPVVAQTASIALENLTAHTVEFNPFVSADQRRRQAGAWRGWFKSLSWESHEKALITRLKGTDRASKHKAVVALGHIGGDNAKSALRQFLIQESKTNPYKKRGPAEGITFAADSRLNPRTGQEAARALGYLQDPAGIAVLKDILGGNLSSRKGNLFLAEACLEAMSAIGDKQLEDYMIKTFGRLEEFHEYYNWYGGGHPYNEVSMPHFRILDVLDRIGSAKTAGLVPAIIRSLPIDVDRQLLFELDDYELMAGRVVKRSGCEDKVVETCLALLGDTKAVADDTFKPSVSKLYRAFAGRPKLENRAAQVLSILCTDRKYEPRIRAVFNRYRERKRDPLFRTSKIRSLVPDRPWVLFYTARLLGKLADPGSSACLISALDKDPAEAAFGRPAPDSIWVGMLQEDNTPCYRAAAAYALGRIGKRSATDVLIKTLVNMDNALDVRHASATALKRIADDKTIQAIVKLAANYPDVSVKKVLLSIGRRDK
jgi:HEAT repeat protein